MSLFEKDVVDIRRWSKKDDEKELPPSFLHIGYATTSHANGTKSRRPVKAVSLTQPLARGQVVGRRSIFPVASGHVYDQAR